MFSEINEENNSIECEKGFRMVLFIMTSALLIGVTIGVFIGVCIK